MRIAVFSDTHGNPIALDAVLADIADSGGVDAHWFVGDAAMIGLDPVGTVERLVGLPGLVAVRGNGDRRLATDPAVVREITARVIASIDDAGEASIWRQVLADSEWTREALREAGLYEWVAALPLEQRLTLPDGTRVLLVHASPGTDEGPGIHAAQSDDELGEILAGGGRPRLRRPHPHAPGLLRWRRARGQPRQREQPARDRQARDVDAAGGRRIRLPAGAPVCALRPRRGADGTRPPQRPRPRLRAAVLPGKECLR